jgi:DNA modification methylase
VSHRIERIGDCELHLGDCAEILPTLGRFDALVTDPPYGIKESAGKNASRSKPMKGHELKMPGRTIIARDYGSDAWDDATADGPVAQAVAQARWSVVFGGNYYNFPPTSCWLVWDKLNGDSDFADCELAWTNMPKAVRRIRFLWNGMLRWERDVQRVHPTQKPVGVMKWCIEQLPEPSRTILDPFMGSGTTGVACIALGRKFTGIERELKYFDIACRRIEEAYKQPDMFVSAPAPKAEQLDLLGAAE